MDYGLFRSFDKIAETTFPRTAQEKGLFLLELEFKDATTRSIPIQLKASRSQFGEIIRLQLPTSQWRFSSNAQGRIEKCLALAKPPIDLNFDNDNASFTFIAQEPAKEQWLSGALILDEKDELITLVARLHA